MLFTRSIHMALSDGGGEPPEWLHLVPAGTFKGVDGRGPFHLNDARGVIAASDDKIVLDENHSTDLAAPQGAEAPARGWIVELQAREDGIWGRVEWTQSGRQLMADKAYRGISPVFTADKAGNVVRLLRASLTNNPNLSDLATLHQQETGVLDLKKFCAALGLPETADEAAVLSAIAAGRTAVAAAAAHQQQIAAVIAAAGSKAADVNGLVTELQARQSVAGDVQAMAAKVVSLETELNSIKAATSRSRAETFVDGAIADGKPVNALRDHYVTRHMADPAAVEKEIGAMVSINAGGMTRPQRNDAGDGDDLTDEEMAVCRKMGQDPKKFAAQRKANLEAKQKRGW